MLTQRQLLIVLLRFAGLITMSAFLAMLLPVEWMASTHRWLGLGELPRSPVVDYLARSVAALYGFHGVLLWLIARDPERHASIVRFVGWMNIGFGVMMIVVDVHAGLPLWWTLGEGPPTAMFGGVVLYLSRSL
jgi:hypothetical protein